jgi:hypothetical protein
MRPRTLTEAYTTVREMNLGPAGMGTQPVGKPVIVSVDLPADDIETEYANEGEEEDAGEVELACASLYKLAEYAPKLLEIIKSKPSLDGWVSSKIALADDYISEVYHRLDYKSKSGVCSQCNTAHSGSCANSTGMYMTGHADANNKF